MLILIIYNLSKWLDYILEPTWLNKLWILSTTTYRGLAWIYRSWDYGICANFRSRAVLKSRVDLIWCIVPSLENILLLGIRLAICSFWSIPLGVLTPLSSWEISVQNHQSWVYYLVVFIVLTLLTSKLRIFLFSLVIFFYLLDTRE